jgi:hypothetical protein
MSVTTLTNSEAREIAALWQSPGSEGIGMAQFASTGTISEALLEDLDREITDQENETGDEERMRDVASNLAELRALRDYVMAQTVIVWSVGENTAGYLPENGNTYALDYSDALAAYVDMIEEAPKSLCGEECECTDDDTCDGCSMAAHVAAYVRDELPGMVGHKVFGEARTLALSLCSDTMSLPRVYWLDTVAMKVSEYVAETE